MRFSCFSDTYMCDVRYKVWLSVSGDLVGKCCRYEFDGSDGADSIEEVIYCWFTAQMRWHARDVDGEPFVGCQHA